MRQRAKGLGPDTVVARGTCPDMEEPEAARSGAAEPVHASAPPSSAIPSNAEVARIGPRGSVRSTSQQFRGTGPVYQGQRSRRRQGNAGEDGHAGSAQGHQQSAGAGAEQS